MVNCPVCGTDASPYKVQLHLEKGCPTPVRTSLVSKSGSDDTPVKKIRVHSNVFIQSSDKKVQTREEEPSPPTASHKTSSHDNPVSVKRENTHIPETSGNRPKSSKKPLAEQCRPSSLEELVGQDHLVGEHGVLRRLLESGNVPSMILWGPSGVGKTSFSRLVAKECKARFVELSAPHASTTDIKNTVSTARKDWTLTRRPTILFLDEIHRFSRTQQDSLLAAVENGDIVLIGATTENPSFKLSSALLSRTRVFVLNSLDTASLIRLIEKALNKFGINDLEYDHKMMIAHSAQGDGRTALNMLETILTIPHPRKDDQVKQVLRTTVVYDQLGENHYDTISAFHKSVRGSDADAALYYLGRMLVGGEDPLYVARRMIRIASEDIGVADDSCLPFAVSAYHAAQQVGMPEVDVVLAHCAVKLARAPKSVEVYKAYKNLVSDLESDPLIASAAIPLHLRNAPTKLLKDIGYGANYKYNPDYEGPVDQMYLPESLANYRWLPQS